MLAEKEKVSPSAEEIRFRWEKTIDNMTEGVEIPTPQPPTHESVLTRLLRERLKESAEEYERRKSEDQDCGIYP